MCIYVIVNPTVNSLLGTASICFFFNPVSHNPAVREHFESSSDIFKRQQKTYLRKLLAGWRGKQSR